MVGQQDYTMAIHPCTVCINCAGQSIRLTWRLSVFHFACPATSHGVHPPTEATFAALLESSPIAETNNSNNLLVENKKRIRFLKQKIVLYE